MVCSKENWVRGKLLKPNPPFVFTLQNFLWTLSFDESSRLPVLQRGILQKRKSLPYQRRTPVYLQTTLSSTGTTLPLRQLHLLVINAINNKSSCSCSYRTSVLVYRQTLKCCWRYYDFYRNGLTAHCDPPHHR